MTKLSKPILPSNFSKYGGLFLSDDIFQLKYKCNCYLKIFSFECTMKIHFYFVRIVYKLKITVSLVLSSYVSFHTLPPYFYKLEGRIGLDKWVIFSITYGYFVLKLCRIVDEITSFRTDTESASQILFFFLIFIFFFFFIHFRLLLRSIFLQNNNLQSIGFQFQKSRRKTDMGTLRYWHCHSNCQQI